MVLKGVGMCTYEHQTMVNALALSLLQRQSSILSIGGVKGCWYAHLLTPNNGKCIGFHCYKGN